MKKTISYLILCLLIPITILLGTTVFGGKQYAFFTIAVAVFSCLPMFIAFEKKDHGTTRLILIAVLTALSVLGRFLFVMLPAFKPVTAMAIITALYFGPEAGFMTGALTAVISNFYFGQGPWTPFQMFAFGMLGFFAGLLSKTLKKSRLLLLGYGVLAGVFYSLVLDVFSALWQDNIFSWARYAAMLVSSLPMTAVYAVSNVIFLLLLEKPVGEKLSRIKTKYGI
ncbi:MAG: ECF transporter S component [Clostridia bacterium]|nr:ECF transporter S component [Clostridia bacterium]